MLSFNIPLEINEKRVLKRRFAVPLDRNHPNIVGVFDQRLPQPSLIPGMLPVQNDLADLHSDYAAPQIRLYRYIRRILFSIF